VVRVALLQVSRGDRRRFGFATWDRPHSLLRGPLRG
jgi:hypothetical protein